MLIKEQQAKAVSISVETPEKGWKKIVGIIVITLSILSLGYAVISFSVEPVTLQQHLGKLSGLFGDTFLWMLAVGFFAQLVDGAYIGHHVIAWRC